MILNVHQIVPRRVLTAVAFLWLALPLVAQTNKVFFAPPPVWVHPTEWAATAIPVRAEKSEATRVLLNEIQENTKRSEEYARTVLLMENETGVQDCGSLSFSFDPDFQELLLHRVIIHRAGQAIDRLDRAKVRVIQPEPDLAGHLISGRQTALVFVEDLRVGDALEYAYTIRGANPILGGHYASQFVIQSGVPFERKLFRVVWESRTPLQQRTHLSEAQPVTQATAQGTEYTWSFTNLAAIPYEDYQPASFEPYPYIELSDFPDWSSVVNWALPLYAPSRSSVPAELRDLISRWQSSASSLEEQARLALQFVQDDLRYTGIELGPDSYRPTDPMETFQKRYGDCKGKVVLLCFLLRALNIEAYPALVNTYSGEAIAQRLPSPFAFNHVIVKLELEGKTVWVDPTSSHQGGSLWNRYLPPYGKALIIRAGSQALEDIPRAQPDNASKQQEISTIRITGYDAPAHFTVRTEYRGASADNMREEIARGDPHELANKYLNYYARFYSGIRTNQALKIADDRLQNLVSIEESYLITNLWTFDQTEKLWKVQFYADNLYGALTDPSTRLRKNPLRFAYPLQRRQEITVHLPDADWKIPDLEKAVDHDAFAFNYRRKLNGSTVSYHYDCRTKLAALPAERVPGYLVKLGEMENLLSDALQRSDRKKTSAGQRINWLMVLIAVFGVGFTAVAGVWVWRRTNTSAALGTALSADLTLEEQKLRGLGGWLILVGIGLCLGPVIRIATLGQNWEGYLSIQTWQSVALPQGELYHPLYGPLLIFELLGNTVLLGLNMLALCLFFSKRRAFPKVYIALMVFNGVFLVLDDLGCAQIPSLHSGNADPKQYSAGVRALFYAILWSTYMLKSRRVKATFVK